jgi:hypothetical protein
LEYYSVKSVEKAFGIFFELLKNGELTIKDQRDLFEAYVEDTEVYEIIRDIIEKHSDTSIIKTEDTLYITPGIHNRVFGYSNEEMRKRMGLSNNLELYTVYFVILNIIAMFYSGEGYDMKYRQYITAMELEGFITEKARLISQLNLREPEEELTYNFHKMAEKWLDMPEYDDNIKILSASRNTRLGFIAKACRFLEEENLARFHDEREIYTTPKMDKMVTGFYTSTSRKEKIMEILENLPSYRREKDAEDKSNKDT